MSNRKKTTQIKSTSMALVPVVSRTTAPVVVETRVPNGKSARRRRARARKKSMGGARGGNKSGAYKYACMLNNPFDCQPITLGFGTMVPTRTAFSYIRKSFTTNPTDGSFQIWLSPTQVGKNPTAAGGGYLMIDNLLSTDTPTFVAGAYAASNQANLVASFDQFRPLAAGMRIWVLAAATSAPGILFAGQYNPDANGYIANSTATPLTSAGISNLPGSVMVKGNEPTQVTWRPDDLARFDFSTLAQLSNSNAFSIGPAIYCTGTGFPGGCTVFVEAVSHFEGYATSRASASFNDNIQPLSTEIPSIDSLWGKAKDYLQSTVETTVEWMSRQENRETIAATFNALNPMFPRSQFAESHNSGFRSIEYKEP